VARHDGEAEAWRYVVKQIQTDVDSMRQLREMQEAQLDEQDAFAEKLESLPWEKAFKMADKAEAQLKKSIERGDDLQRRYEAAAERRDFDKLRRALDKARAEYEAIAVAMRATHSHVNGEGKRSQLRGDEFTARMALSRAEYELKTAELRASKDYGRLVAEIKKTSHAVTDDLLGTIREIEARKGGNWCWRAGMSIDPREYHSPSAAELGIGLFNEQPGPIIARGRPWNPFKF
ncbi:MAG: hypothetical protein ACREXP_10805, partial [Steroidobacteraceae bacterium]